MSTVADREYLLEMRGIIKKFPGVTALNHVDFSLRAGEVHVLCGENGAGKSTLMKILAGIYQPTEGTMRLSGELLVLQDPGDSEAKGIAIVHQELSLCPNITVGENIFLGVEPRNRGVIDRKRMYSEASALFDKLGCHINPAETLGMLTIASQQLVQIAKALSSNPQILILDEPFSSLSDEEANTLFGIMKGLRDQGVGIIYIDHRIDNFYRIGDRLTVLRDGNFVDTVNVQDVTREQVISMMVGRDIENLYPKYNQVKDGEAFSAKGLTTAHVKDITFSVREGEIFGLGGLVGAGRTEVCKAIFGTDKKTAGEVVLKGRQVSIRSVADSVRNGIALIPENRKLEGLCLGRSIRFNTSIIIIEKLRKMLWIDSRKEKKLTQMQMEKLKVKFNHADDLISNLSGGNQQKVVLAKWLLVDNLEVLLLDEPTRGIDVGAKQEIYRLINELANAGIAIVLVTSELPELINLCDRVAVVRSGRISGILDREQLTQENIMELCV